MVTGNWSQEEKTNLLVHGVKANTCRTFMHSPPWILQ